MSDLIWYLIKRVKPRSVFFEPLLQTSPAHSLGDLLKTDYFICWIDADKIKEKREQVFNLLHEILHDHPQFRGKSYADEHRNPRIENEIDKTAKKILKTRRGVAKFLLNIIKEAKIIRSKEQ